MYYKTDTFVLNPALTLKLGLFPLIGALGWVPFVPLSRDERPLAPSSRGASLAVALCFVLAALCATRPSAWQPIATSATALPRRRRHWSGADG